MDTSDRSLEYPNVAKAYEQRVRPAVEEIKRTYHQNFFPEMKVSWQAYPDNLGHKEFPGCFRCHDGKHVTNRGMGDPNAPAGMSPCAHPSGP